MEGPPPSQLLLQAEAAAAPPFFQPISAANTLTSMLKRADETSSSSLTTGVPEIDAKDGVLGGGIPTGSVIGISSDSSRGMGRTLALKMMCRQLMGIGNKEKRGMIIDSTGTFDLEKLVEVAKGCTTREYTNGAARMIWRERQEVESVLERVGITRVFDLEGVWDVIGEIRAGRTEEETHGQEFIDQHDEREEHQEKMARESTSLDEEGQEAHNTSIRGGASQEQNKNHEADRQLRVKLQAPNHPRAPVQPFAHSILEMEDIRFDDTQPAHPFAPSAGPPVIPDSPKSPPTPDLPPAQSSGLTPPPPSAPVETSSPLSSPPKSPAPSSSLHSELVIEPSPERQNMNTVLSQAYQGEPMPSSSSEAEVEPSPQPAIISPSPLPPSSPPVLLTPAPAFNPPTTGFESHMSEAARPGKHNPESDSDSASDTSSYVSDPTLERNRHPLDSWTAACRVKPPSILIIDSLPPLLANLFVEGCDRTASHKQLQQLTRVLTEMTRSISHPLTVLVINSTTTLSLAKSIEEAILRSVFADVKHVPSFGAVYDGMIDLSLLVSKLPARQEDAERLYGYGEAGRSARWTNVVECLRDDAPDLQRWIGKDDGKVERKRKERPKRRTNREGRWGAFDIVIEQGQEGGELLFKDPELGRTLGRTEVVYFGRRS